MRPWSEVPSMSEGLHTEIDDCAANLHCLVEPRDQHSSVFYQNESSKLAEVILKEELVVLEFDDSVAPANRNVIDAKIALMASA